MSVITLSQVKTYLGISDTSQDTAISAMIPIIDAKVKLICGSNFHKQLYCQTTADSPNVIIYGDDVTFNYQTNPTPDVRLLLSELQSGTTITGDGIPDDSYITEVYYEGGLYEYTYTPYFVLNAKATESSNSVYLYAGINIAYHPVIAKGIQWLINQQTTDISDGLWTSRSVGPLSVSKSVTDNRFEQKYGMPAWFVKALPRYHK